MARRLRVLVIAEAANPEWASVPLVGWNVSRALQVVADVHVVTQIRNRDAIERAGWREGREYTAIDSELVAGPCWKLSEALRRVIGLGSTQWTALSSLAYYYFESLVWRRFGEAIRTRRIDVVHRVTPLSPTTPSILASHCLRAGVPFVWGPLNGGFAWPREFSGVRRQEGEVLSGMRGLHRLMPGYRSSRTDAAAILVGSRATWEQLAGYHDRAIYMPENGIDPSRFSRRASRGSGGPLRVAFIGRLVPVKGVDMLIEAAAPLVRSRLVEIDICGDGPQKPLLQSQCAEAGLGDSVRFHGWVSQSELQERLALADVLAFPSIRDFGGAVVLEGMAMGLVPVVVDYGGPAELVTQRTGFRVPLTSRALVVTGFRDVLAELTKRPELRVEIGERAYRRAHTLYSWDAKARQVLEVYRWILGERDKPDFGMPFPDADG